jgi:hypothetical protein|tara:strand:+ start:1437 stop:1658 length:222 start_codon:yes stop_codon:yes gene_type:complete
MSNQKYNVQTILLGEDEDKDLMKIECFSNRRDEISVRIWPDNSPNSVELISLDKSTAIKLAKILRTEINKIQS